MSVAPDPRHARARHVSVPEATTLHATRAPVDALHAPRAHARVRATPCRARRLPAPWTLFLIKRSRSLSLCGITCSNVRRHTCSTERERERERGFCLLKGIAEGTYQTKHAEAARPYYTTIHTHTHMHRHDRHASQLELGHARERRCAPNRREQRVVARHEAQQHDGAR
jgi:hypothetical protein